NGSVHSYDYDVLGRQTADIVTTVGSGVFSTIRRLGTTYNALGLIETQTSYTDTSGTNPFNQVEDLYNGLGQITNQYQNPIGVVDTSTSPDVQYVYNEMAGGENNSRLRSIVYPNGRILDYDYSANQQPVTSLTSSGTTVTVDSASSLGISIGDTIVIEGAGAPYDGSFTVTSVGT